jgi:4a-hydroxytetrahydrobiopterin dehydratase
LIRPEICAKSWRSSRKNPSSGYSRPREKKGAGFPVAKAKGDVTRVAVMADLIKADELKNRLKKIPEWELEKKHIERTFEFDEFSEAIDFVNSVAEVAEEEEHHPDIDIRFNKVRLILSTHSKGGLTDLDFSLAERIDTLSE